MANKNTAGGAGIKNTGYELFILLLSLLSLFNLMLFILPEFDPVVEGVIRIMDSLITIIFMMDFVYRLFTAQSKFNYFFRDWGWADLLASLPVAQLKIFRIFRVIRVFRILQTFGLRKMFHELVHNRAGSALFLTVTVVIFVLEFGGMAIVYSEAGVPGSTIMNGSDGVWWAFVTITTVGYGDVYPVTREGRAIGLMVMTLGVGTFGVLTGFLANAFLAPPEVDNDDQVEVGVDANGDLAEFRRLLEEQEKLNAALRVKLEQLESRNAAHI